MRNDGVSGGEAGFKADTSLDSYYISTLQDSFHETTDNVVRSVLGTVVLAGCPLPPSAIATLTGLQRAQVQGVLQSLQLFLTQPEGPDSPVQFLHKTFPDFVTDATRCTDLRFYILYPLTITPNFSTTASILIRCVQIGCLASRYLSVNS